jgi:hypothetical protein
MIGSGQITCLRREVCIMLETKILTCRTPKAGEAEADCEDSVHAGPTGNSNRIFAVADGTTQSFCARLWAEELTGYFAKQPDEAFADWAAWLRVPQRTWREAVRRRLESAPDDVYIYNGFHERRPGAATFVGLRLFPMETGDVIPWEALVLGDSCLFHLRPGANVRCYLKQKEADFDFLTEAAESYPKTSLHLPTRLCCSSDQNAGSNGAAGAQPGDCFLLATDAFSKWMLARHSAGEPVWGVVASLKSEFEFQELVSAARNDATRPLQNDDVGLVVVRFGQLHAAFAAQKYEPKPAAYLPTKLGLLGRKAQPEEPKSVVADPKRLPLPKSIPVTRHPPRSSVSKRPSLLYGMFGTASALGLSLLINFLLAVNLKRSYREKAEELQSIHSLIQTLSSSISRLSDEVDKLDQELRDKLQKSTDVGNKERRSPESAQGPKISGGAEPQATNRKIWVPNILQEPPRRSTPLKPAEVFKGSKQNTREADRGAG